MLRVLSDNQGALCHLVLQYIDWLALQLLPDTAETEWSRPAPGHIWLVNSDGLDRAQAGVARQRSGDVLRTARRDRDPARDANDLRHDDRLSGQTARSSRSGQTMAANAPIMAGGTRLAPAIF